MPSSEYWRELEDVEPRGAAQGIAHLPGLHLGEHAGEQLGQPVVAAPADRAALQGVGSVGIARGDAAKRRAALYFAQCLLGAFARLADALRARPLGHAHEDVGDVVLGVVGARLRLLEEDVHFRLAHLHAVLHLALAQPRHDHLAADIGAPGVEAHAVGLERAAEIREGHVVGRGDALHRAVDLQVVDADARLARELQLRLVEDQPLEHLALERRRESGGDEQKLAHQNTCWNGNCGRALGGVSAGSVRLSTE